MVYCKVLGLVPRHQEIVATILGEEFASVLTRMIGLGEIGLALAIWCGFRPRILAVFQIALILTMNVLEFFRAPEYLLWGKMNAVFAVFFCVVIYLAAFVVRPNSLPRNELP